MEEDHRQRIQVRPARKFPNFLPFGIISIIGISCIDTCIFGELTNFRRPNSGRVLYASVSNGSGSSDIFVNAAARSSDVLLVKAQALSRVEYVRTLGLALAFPLW